MPKLHKNLPMRQRRSTLELVHNGTDFLSLSVVGQEESDLVGDFVCSRKERRRAELTHYCIWSGHNADC